MHVSAKCDGLKADCSSIVLQNYPVVKSYLKFRSTQMEKETQGIIWGSTVLFVK